MVNFCTGERESLFWNVPHLKHNWADGQIVQKEMWNILRFDIQMHFCDQPLNDHKKLR